MRTKAIPLLLVVLIVGVAQPARAQSDAAKTPRTLEVVGNGEARATPDQATMDVAIETHAATADQAASQNAALSLRVVAALKTKLGDRGRIWTGGYNLYPEYSEAKDQTKPRIIGYQAENTVSVETGALDRVGALIDAAIAAGANRVNSLSFGLREDALARSEAIARASKDAQAQAKALAAALGLKLKQIISANTGEVPHPGPLANRMFAAVPMAERIPTPVSPGEITVPATVTLIYEVE